MTIKQILLERHEHPITEAMALCLYNNKLERERKNKIEEFTELLENNPSNILQRQIDQYTKLIQEYNAKKEFILNSIQNLKQQIQSSNEIVEKFLLDAQDSVDELNKIISIYEKKITIANTSLNQNDDLDNIVKVDKKYINTQIASMIENCLMMRDFYKIQIKNESTRAYMEGDFAFINYLSHTKESAQIVAMEVEEGLLDDRGVRELIDFLQEEHSINMDYTIAFNLRLNLIEYYKVVALSTKVKLDYNKNYLDQYKSLYDKVCSIGAIIGAPLRNPKKLKDLIVLTIQAYSPNEEHAKIVIEELLDEKQNRIKKRNFSRP